jgi:CRISPR-associated exonuclease Cas4
MTLPLAIVVLIVALALFWQAGRKRKAAGLPGGQVIYADTSHWGAVEKPYYDPDLRLTGKPDYVIAQGDTLIPVEVKSTRHPEAPYDSHIFQLAAYCYLIERATANRPPYGLIHYPEGSRTFRVEYTHQLETTLLETLAEIRIQERRKQVHRSHQAAARCQACGYSSVCQERL